MRGSLFASYAASTRDPRVFFERKNRVACRPWRWLHEVLGEREFCLARELTKKHEQFINGRLGQAPDFEGDLLGEVTVVIGPPE